MFTYLSLEWMKVCNNPLTHFCDFQFCHHSIIGDEINDHVVYRMGELSTRQYFVAAIPLQQIPAG